jgi:hypothetical protein
MADSFQDQSDKAKGISTLHIDTSIQIERCKSLRKAEPIEQALKEFRFKSTSTYAKLEFKRAWLQNLAYLHSASFRVQRDDDLFEYVNDKLGAHPAHRRKMSTCLQALISFLSRVKAPLSPEVRLLRLRSHIRQALLGAYAWWTEYSVEHEFDGTGCVRAQEKPRERGERLDVSIPKCDRSKINCSIHQFFVDNCDTFQAIKAGIEALGDKASDELKRTSDIVAKAENDSTSLCSSRICSALGDAIIAVDGNKMDCFAANNDKEWQVLAEVLSKRLINPVRKEP